MINRSFGPLYEKLDSAHEQMRSARTPEEKVALANYIGNLYCSLLCMGDTEVNINKYRCFGGKKNYDRFLRRIDIYSDQMLRNFVICKDFHQHYLGEILPTVEKEMSEVGAMTFPEETPLQKKEFFEIFYLFLNSLGLADQFDQFYKNNHIHSSILGHDDGNLGFTLHNPVTRETDLFVKNFCFDFTSMNTLAHEFGHGVDLQEFKGDFAEYNRYFYASFYGEVFSRLMERLLYHFFLKNGIRTFTVKDKMIDFELLNHDFLLQSYILSLLGDGFLLNQSHIDCDSATLANKVKKYFLEDADIQGFIERMGDMDLMEAFTYAYGDIISMFLCDEVERGGLYNEMVKYFMKNRSSLFKEDFMRECGFGPKKYNKLYKKEIELIKK